MSICIIVLRENPKGYSFKFIKKTCTVNKSLTLVIKIIDLNLNAEVVL